jgi:hypothetical protein
LAKKLLRYFRGVISPLGGAVGGELHRHSKLNRVNLSQDTSQLRPRSTRKPIKIVDPVDQRVCWQMKLALGAFRRSRVDNMTVRNYFADVVDLAL